MLKLKKINLGDLIFILFYKYGGEIKGSTTLQKLVDVIRLDSEFEVDVNYSPYDYGDFATQVNDIIQVYQDNNWVTKKEVQFQADKRIDIYNLTPTGNKIAKTLTDNLLSSELKALNILDKFAKKGQKDIISFSYFWYPKTAINSKIKNDIFKKKSIFSNLEGDLEKEYNSIINSGYSIKDMIRESWRC
jgi:DNA-binding MarR family transcriptional regulator